MAVAGILRLRENLDVPDAAILHSLGFLFQQSIMRSGRHE
jgi:hypothetical protein